MSVAGIVAVHDSLRGADGQPLVYPVPLVVRNTFIDCFDRPPSFEEFFLERKVVSCPVSMVSQDGMTDTRFQPTVLPPPIASTLVRSKTAGSCPAIAAAVVASAASAAAKVAAPWRRHLKTAVSDPISIEEHPVPQSGSRSECSTTDSVERSIPTTPDHNGAVNLRGSTTGSEAASTTIPVLATNTRSIVCPPPPLHAPPAIILRLQDVVAPAAPSGGSWTPEVEDWSQAGAQLYGFQDQFQGHSGPANVIPQATYASVPLDALKTSLDMLPSIGSVGHMTGDCKPCAFLHSKGCVSGNNCVFCHLCDSGEKKRRQKEKKAFFSNVNKFRQFVTASLPSFQASTA